MNAIVEIVKDTLDYVSIYANIICSIVSLILVYLCSAMLSDKKKKHEQEFNALNYLTICTNRYLKHVLGIWQIVRLRKGYLQEFIQDPDDKLKFFRAFQIIRPPIPNFEVRLPEYAFTVKKQPLLVDSLLKYIEKYSEVIETIDFFNRQTDIVLHSDIPRNKIVDLAKTSLKDNMEESNLFRWEVAICFTVYELNHLLELIHEYQYKNKYKNYAWIDVQGLVLERVKEAEAFLDKYWPDKNWRLDLIDPNDYFQNKNHWFKNFYQNIFSVKNENIHKVVRIFGFKISFRRKQYINETTIINSNKMQQAQIQLLNIILNMMSPINNAVHNIWSRMDDILKTVSDNNNKESKQ